MAVFLISPTEYKDRTPVHGNVDDKLIRQTIFDCQDMYVQVLVGTGIYNELLDQVENSTLTALNTTLLNTYLQPGMRHWITANIIKPITFRMMDIGVQTKDSGNTTPIDTKYIQNLEDYYRNRSEFYAERVTRYLCENSTSYPLYDNPGNGADIIHPTRKNYRTSLYIPKRNKVTGIDSFSDREHYGQD